MTHKSGSAVILGQRELAIERQQSQGVSGRAYVGDGDVGMAGVAGLNATTPGAVLPVRLRREHEDDDTAHRNQSG